MLIIFAVERTRHTTIFSLAVASPGGVTLLLMGTVTRTAAIQWRTSRVLRGIPIRFASGQVGDMVAYLLIHSTCNWAGISLRSAPTVVVNGINALIFPGCITRAASGQIGTELLHRSRPIDISFGVIDIGGTISLIASAGNWAAAPRLIPAVSRPLILALVLCLFVAGHSEGVITALRLGMAGLHPIGIALHFPLFVARAAFIIGGASERYLHHRCIQIHFSIFGVDRAVTILLAARRVTATAVCIGCAVLKSSAGFVKGAESTLKAVQVRHICTLRCLHESQ